MKGERMGRLLLRLAPGICVAALAVSAACAFKLWSDIGRNKVARPTPIRTRRVIPIYDGTSVWDTGIRGMARR